MKAIIQNASFGLNQSHLVYIINLLDRGRTLY
jgi:hypothetical protein